MKAIAVTPGKKNTAQVVDAPRPSVADVPAGRGVLVEVLRVGVDGTDREINDAQYGRAPEGEPYSFVLMSVVLAVSASRRAAWTGVCAGTLVALFITFEAPLSGMSMNPARSFGSAMAAGELGALWIYFLAPPLGMLAAAAGMRRRAARACAKLRHAPDVPCIFCGQGMSETAPRRPSPPHRTLGCWEAPSSPGASAAAPV